MAEATKDHVTCPNCGNTSDTEIWESLNSLLNRDEVEQLLEGTLFMHECPECHASIELTYPCLYNGMESGMMVQYIVDEAKLDEAIQMIEGMNADEAADGAEADIPVKTRIVTTHNALREKVLMSQDGLDDMAVELVKAVMMNRFIDEGQINGEAEVFYGGLTDARDLVLAFIVDGKSAQTMVPQALYNRVLGMVEQSVYAQKGAYIVDAVWAELFFKNQAGQ